MLSTSRFFIKQFHQTSENPTSQDQTAATNATTGTEDLTTVLLQVLPLRVVDCNGSSITTFALLDSASEVTLVDPSLVSCLGLYGRSDRLVFSTISDNNELQEGERRPHS